MPLPILSTAHHPDTAQFSAYLGTPPNTNQNLLNPISPIKPEFVSWVVTF